MENKNNYWKGLEEFHHEPEFEKQRADEFAEKLPLSEIATESELNLNSNRRDFLKFMGFGITAATLAACTRTPVKKAIPYLIKPEEIDPGVANYYATTCGGCSAGCSLLVKTREGRPIKVDGLEATDKTSPINQGAACAVGQGTVLSLYDTGRLDQPRKGTSAVSWSSIDKDMMSALNAGGNIRILTGTVNSPSSLAVINDFIAKYPTTKHVMYDAVSYSALRDAHKAMFGKAMLPSYNFSKAKMVVSLGADFLGSWLSPVEFTKGYTSARSDKNADSFLYHVQFESRLSLSGSNADLRVPMKPSQTGQVLAKLYSIISGNGAGGSLELAGNAIAHTAKELIKNKGAAIVITDSNDADHQMLVAAINNALGNYGTTLDVANASNQKTGDDKAMAELVSEMNAGSVSTLIVWGCNPSYTYPDKKFNDGLKKVKTVVSLNDRVDETGLLATYVAPDHHSLESWGDNNPKEGIYTLLQPTISPILKTRQAQESLLAWTGSSVSYYEYVRKNWKRNMLNKQSAVSNFEDFWANCLHDGIFQTPASSTTPTATVGNINDVVNKLSSSAKSDGIEVVLYEKVAIRDGSGSNNPWLQEMPDPVSKVTWDNYACISPKWAKEKGIANEDLVEIKASGRETIQLPALVQPGQPYGTIAIAVGFGRKMDKDAGKVANGIGANAYPLANIVDGNAVLSGQRIDVSKAGGTYPLALTQTHHNMEGRDLVRDMTLAELASEHGGKEGHEAGGHELISLYQDYRYPGQKWGLAVDLSACTGCNACVVSCSAENNVPVVGKDEVRRRREMHWIRIDRYYAIPDDKHAMHTEYKEIDALEAENKADFENVKVVFQPMMCQQCTNAPCENVCPVNAISHSSDGLNQQVYNRCVGTRYCANNCPYKVRRFNWFNYSQNDKFDYHMNNDLGRMVLNPDVTVRVRGVMEKCTFCVQRIQASKLKAKKEERAMNDGDVVVACQQTCPANAIVFGDMNNPDSKISQLMKNKRAYGILTELNTRPSVTYLSKVRKTVEA